MKCSQIVTDHENLASGRNKPRRSLGALLILSILAQAPDAEARPPYKKALAEHFGPLLAKKLNDCVTCHLPDAPGMEEGTKPHNPFGARLAAVRKELRKAGKPADILDRVHAIADEDADGDGVANLLEILSGHFPGDAKDTPSQTEVTVAQKALLAFRQKEKAYPWRPFDTVHRPEVPRVKNQAWVRNPVDAFLAVEHERLGLKPRPEAPRHVLLRRVYLDLIGLPPTPEEVHAFVNNPAPDAYEKVIDRLLASPHHGERWGRHWMDIWRYSDWAGYGAEVRDSQPHIWRWRDWIIESINADKGYDRMIQEMLAGDELAPADADVLRATGFLVRNWYKFNRNVWLERTVEHTSKAFLGVTLNCARCHDHMFDPITQKEFFQFRAFFETHNIRTDRVPGQTDTSKDGLVRVYDDKLEAPTYLFVRGEENKPDKKASLPPAFPSLLGGIPLEIRPVSLPPAAIYPEKQTAFKERALKVAQTALDSARANLDLSPKRKQGPGSDRDLAQLEVDIAQARLVALKAIHEVEAVEDAGTKGEAWEKLAKDTLEAQRHVSRLEARKNLALARQAISQVKPPVPPAAKKKIDEAEKAFAKAEEVAKQPLTTAYAKRNLAALKLPTTSSGRRLALARWIADKSNPLTARVAVNHIWLRHFGKPLVPSVFDFGGNGRPPSHPALLDWLAAEFMEPSSTPGRPWSMKSLHRLLLTSNAYRMDSTADPDNTEKDQDNRYFWRMNFRRMESEIIRDSILAVSGQLDRTMGGPELDQKLGLTTYRRSIYYRHAPEKLMEFMEMFDAANVTECYQRTESVIPQQALAMANSSLVLAQARLLARDLAKKQGTKADGDAFIKIGFDHVLGRQPTTQELGLCQQFLTSQAGLLNSPKDLSPFTSGAPCPVPPSIDPQLRAREDLLHVLMNHNEFMTIR